MNEILDYRCHKSRYNSGSGTAPICGDIQNVLIPSSEGQGRGTGKSFLTTNTQNVYGFGEPTQICDTDYEYDKPF